MTVDTWTAREVRALRDANRLTVEAFASKLGVSTRIINKWESGDSVPRPSNQQNLDTYLAQYTPSDARARFSAATGLASPEVAASTDTPTDVAESAPLPEDTHIRHPRDGKEMALVAEGVFLSGQHGDTPLWIPAFYMDTYPVTNADYLRFIAATGYPEPAEWATSGSPTDEMSDHPVVFVTWIDARAYAEWAGKELPTAQQWEKAARGTRGEIYPWGSAMTPAKCNTRESGLRSTTPVDRYHSGASVYGVYDMCGNVWEWCSTEITSGRRVLKGSAFTSPFSRATPSNQNDASTDMKDDDTGFRCVVANNPVGTDMYGNITSRPAAR